MRIVLLVTDLERGGTPLRLARLAQHLHALGHEPVVGCLAAMGPVGESLQQAGIRVFACGARHARDWPALVRLYRWLREIRPQIVHASLTHANVAARIVARLIGIPVVTSTATIEIERPWHLRLERLTARLDRGHVVNGHALAEHVRRRLRVPAERIFVVPPSIGPLGPRIDRADARSRFGLDPQAFVAAWFGRLDPVKRTDLLLQAAETLFAEGVVFLLAGDGPLRLRTEQQIEQRRLTRAVRLLEWQPYVGPLLSAADVFVFPSDTEGMPNSALQAMAAGVPVLAADTPALRELQGPEPRVQLFAPGSAAALCEGLRQLRADPARRTRLAELARAYVQEHVDARRAASETLAVYQRVLGLAAEPPQTSVAPAAGPVKAPG